MRWLGFVQGWIEPVTVLGTAAAPEKRKESRLPGAHPADGDQQPQSKHLFDPKPSTIPRTYGSIFETPGPLAILEEVSKKHELRHTECPKDLK